MPDFKDTSIIQLADNHTRPSILTPRLWAQLAKILSPHTDRAHTAHALEQELRLVLPLDETQSVWVDAMWSGGVVLPDEDPEEEPEIFPVVLLILIRNMDTPIHTILRDAREALISFAPLSDRANLGGIEPFVVWITPMDTFFQPQWPGKESMRTQSRQAQLDAKISRAQQWLTRERIIALPQD